MKMSYTHFRADTATFLANVWANRQAYCTTLALLHRSKKFENQVARSVDKVFYHIFLTCKCFMVINVRWLLSLFYTISHTCSSSYVLA